MGVGSWGGMMNPFTSLMLMRAATKTRNSSKPKDDKPKKKNKKEEKQVRKQEVSSNYPGFRQVGERKPCPCSKRNKVS